MSENTLALATRNLPARAPEDLAAATFLARYTGSTKTTYVFALRRYFTWCRNQGMAPLEMKRPLIEAYIRSMEDDGLARSTQSQQLGIIRGYYRFAVLDEYIDKDPAQHVRKPRVWQDDSKLLGLTRYELGDIFRAAKDTGPTERCAIALMGMLGLRVSEAAGLQIEDTRHEAGGHRVVNFIGKGSKPASIPLPVPMQRIIDAAAAGRTTGPLLVRRRGPLHGEPHDRRSLAWMVEQLGRKAGIDHKVHPHMLRHSFVGTALDAGLDLRTVQQAARHSDPRTTANYDRARHTMDRHAVHTVSAYLGGIA
ncbi:MAG: tyrosine-type recombinase/integrase [Micrococcus sp.]|nr:tyrosine-type recombinase/integrase [Micrococcus sp.]